MPGTLAAGARLGRYIVVAPLGAGGMGEVYRVTDTRLNRDVALKILPDVFAQDADRLARFQREAQVLASLNHPNIAAIHGLEEAGVEGPVEAGRRVRALVLELVEGPTLADRIASGPIPPAEAVAIARQIADALDAAHEHGIVHRDLKPSNIKLREDGMVKVLDFGLAKASDAASRAVDLTQSPTLVSPAATQAGFILGTAAYMSPEQARGRHVDKRSDIWAFGCVFYEMLTGARAFDPSTGSGSSRAQSRDEGDDVTDTMAAILRGEPDWSRIPAGVPPALVRVLKRCLDKDRRLRRHDIADVRMDIDDALSTPAAPEAGGSGPRLRAAIALAMLALAAAAALGGVWLTRAPLAARTSRLAIAPSDTAALGLSVASRSIALTPDGTRVIYTGTSGERLFVRPLDRLEPTALSGLTLAQNPFVSPDGQWVGYFEGSTALKKVPIVGGPPVTICRLDGAGPRGATWGPDGTIVFATANGGLWRVRDAGGEPERLTTPESVGHSRPQFLPGGRTILFTILQSGGNLENARIGVLDLQTGVQRVVLNSGGDARYVPSGHLVYGVPGSLFAVGFDIDRLETVGTPVPIVPGVRTVASGADYDVAPDGTLVYVTGGASAIRRTLAWVDRQGREEPVNKAPPRAYAYPRLSPDNTRLALDIRDQENDIWIWDVRRETLSRFTFAPTLDRSPVWTPDGLRIVFSAAGGNGVAELFWQAANGTGTPERLTESKEFQFATTMSHDGGRVVFWQQRQSRDLMVLSLNQQRRIEPLLHTPAAEINGEISPDGRWIAYQSNESGTDEIYVRPFPAVDAGKWQVSSAGGTQPAWSRDGRELFYAVSGSTMTLMRVGVEASGATWSAGTPTRLFDGPYYTGIAGNNTNRTYDVSRNGRFLMIKEGGEEEAARPTIIVVQHWLDELKRLSR